MFATRCVIAAVCIGFTVAGAAQLPKKRPETGWFGGPYRVIAADFTGDKRLDLLVGYHNSDAVTLEQSVMSPVWYVERLHELGFMVDAWQTTYIHVLTGDNPVLEWFKGTALRPLLNKLAPQAKEEFLQELGNRFKAAYPVEGSITLLPFPRLFFVATRS